MAVLALITGCGEDEVKPPATGVTLSSISLAPDSVSIAKGTFEQITATGTYSDKTTKDITTTVAWSSSDETIVKMSADSGLFNAVAPGEATITATLGATKATATFKVLDATLMGIAVVSKDPWIAKGTTEQFSAIGLFSDGKTQDLTKQAEWSSSDASVTISNDKGSKGLATGAAEGETTIVATALGVSGSVRFRVTAATVVFVDVTPTNPTIAKGTDKQFQATGVLTDGTIEDLTEFATWTSSDAAVATVSDAERSRGLAKGIAAGTSTIKATYKDKSASSLLTVTAATLSKISLTPLNPSMPKGTDLQFAAIGTFSDKTSQNLSEMATWGSSAPTVVDISNVPWTHGIAIALSQGTATITATVSGKSDSTVVTVTPATISSITVTPVDPTIAKGTWINLIATATYSDGSTRDISHQAVWTSADASVYVQNLPWHPGLAKGIAKGTSTVTATFDGKSGATKVTVSDATLSEITVTPTNGSMAKGTTMQMMATGLYSDDSVQDLTYAVVWNSSDASVAVSNTYPHQGLATGIVAGKSTITASFVGKSGSTSVTVTPATLSSIDVTPKDPSLAKGTWRQLVATGTYSDNSKQDLTKAVSWSSANANVYVSNSPKFEGRVLALAEGSSVVTADIAGKSASTTVTVTAATLSSLAITPASATIAKGTVQWFTVNGTFSDNTVQDLTEAASWSSSDMTKAIVSNTEASHGLATGVAPGAATITASYGGKSATASLTVTAATLASIAVTPVNPTISVGGTQQFQAMGTYTDNSVQDITKLITWTSSNVETAIISNAAGSKGLATSVKAGTATIAAHGNGKKGETMLTVN